MKRGEVRWYGFPKPDKRRPVLILMRSRILDYLDEVTVAPITSTIRDIPSEVVLDGTDGMPRDCAVNCDHIQTVPKARIEALLATLTPAKMEAVSRAVRFALDL